MNHFTSATHIFTKPLQFVKTCLTVKAYSYTCKENKQFINNILRGN